MPDPVAEHIAVLEQNNRTLSANLAVCQRERTQSAIYAVSLEDQVHDLVDERAILITAVNHLYQHLAAVPNNPFSQEMCDAIHPKIKEYVS